MAMLKNHDGYGENPNGHGDKSWYYCNDVGAPILVLLYGTDDRIDILISWRTCCSFYLDDDDKDDEDRGDDDDNDSDDHGDDDDGDSSDGHLDIITKGRK